MKPLPEQGDAVFIRRDVLTGEGQDRWWHSGEGEEAQEARSVYPKATLKPLKLGVCRD